MTPQELQQIIDAEIRPACVCGRSAQYVVEQHAINGCVWAGKPGGRITDRGTIVELLCTGCTATLIIHIRDEIARRSELIGREMPGGVLACRGCGRLIRTIHDVVDVSAL